MERQTNFSCRLRHHGGTLLPLPTGEVLVYWRFVLFALWGFSVKILAPGFLPLFLPPHVFSGKCRPTASSALSHLLGRNPAPLLGWKILLQFLVLQTHLWSASAEFVLAIPSKRGTQRSRRRWNGCMQQNTYEYIVSQICACAWGKNAGLFGIPCSSATSSFLCGILCGCGLRRQ